MKNVVAKQGVDFGSDVVTLNGPDRKFPAKIGRGLCLSVLVGCLLVNGVGGASAGLLDDELGGIKAGASDTQVTSSVSGFGSDYIVNSQLSDASYVYRLQHMRPQLAQTEEDVNDPLEGFNRAIFSFNQGFYDIFLGPVSDVYTILPSQVRSMIGGVLSNLSEPVVFMNDVLQGEIERAMTTVGRFIVNSIFGIAGIFDVATELGLDKHNEDFGQTLAVWGVGEGFYLVLPILGPSNPRDLLGRYVVDPWADPVTHYLDNQGHDEWIWVRYGTTLVHEFSEVRDDLEQLDNVSVDYYAAVRSLYRQKRRIAISNGEEMDLPEIPDFTFGDYIDDTQSDPSLGQTSDEALDDQVSYFSLPQLGRGDMSLVDPFAIRFDALDGKASDGKAPDGVSTLADDWNSMPMSPRKPTVLRD